MRKGRQGQAANRAFEPPLRDILFINLWTGLMLYAIVQTLLG
jgi:hypothetical protein